MAAAWNTRLTALAAVAGTAGVIQLIGSAVMYHRLGQVDAPATHTVASLPRDYLFVVGARTIVPFLVLVGLAVVALYVIALITSAPAAPDGSAQNPAGSLPDYYWRMIAVLLVATFAMTWLLLYNPTIGRLALVAVAFAISVGIATVVVRAGDSVAQAAWALFAAMLFVGVIVTVANEISDTVKFDLAAVERANGDRVSGYYLARSGSSVYVLVAPGAIVKKGEGDAQLRVNVIDDAKKLVYGPRNVPVGRKGFLRAARLRTLLDETRPSFTASAEAGQSLRAGVTVRINCKERCHANVRATAVGRRTGRIGLETEQRGLVRPVEARYVLTVPKGSERKIRDRRLRVRVSIVVRDVVRNHASDVEVVQVTR